MTTTYSTGTVKGETAVFEYRDEIAYRRGILHADGTGSLYIAGSNGEWSKTRQHGKACATYVRRLMKQAEAALK